MSQVLDRPTERAVPQRAAPGVNVLPERAARFQRRMVLIVTIVPFAGFVAAIVSMWGWGISVTDLAILLGFYIVSGLGVTVGYHRLFTHKSFEAHPKLRAAIAVAGSMSVEGSIVSWVADHRRHHAFSDQEGDPHSPHLDEGEGIGGILRGLWHAHIGWFFDSEKTDPQRWAPDLLREPAMVRIDRAFPVITLVSFVAPALVGLAVTGSVRGMISAFLWGSLVRVFMLHHVTWSINSICHFYGKRPYQTTDHSTNNWLLSLVSFGESWHNNHHAFPTSAVHGIGRWQFDMSALTIRALERLGLARNVKRVSLKQLESKRG